MYIGSRTEKFLNFDTSSKERIAEVRALEAFMRLGELRLYMFAVARWQTSSIDALSTSYTGSETFGAVSLEMRMSKPHLCEKTARAHAAHNYGKTLCGETYLLAAAERDTLMSLGYSLPDNTCLPCVRAMYDAIEYLMP